MRYFLISFLLLSTFSFAQLSGPIADSGRKLVALFDYKIPGHKAGFFHFNIGVNPDGVVKLCEYDAVHSTIVSTPLMMKAKNHILVNLKFESGAGFPDLQSGTVIIEIFIQN